MEEFDEEYEQEFLGAEEEFWEEEAENTAKIFKELNIDSYREWAEKTFILTKEAGDIPDVQEVERMWDIFLDLTRKETFNKKVREIRSEFGIPAKGYEFTKFGFWGRDEVANRKRDEISRRCYSLANEYGFNHGFWEEVFSNFVLWDIRWFFYCDDVDDVKVVRIVDKEFEEDEDFKDLNASFIDNFPVAIRIHPLARRKDVMKAVEEVFSKKMLDRYLKENIQKNRKIRHKKPESEEVKNYILSRKKEGISSAKIASEVRKRFGRRKIYEREVNNLLSRIKK